MKKILSFLWRNPCKILFAIFFFSLTSYVVMGTLMDESTQAKEMKFNPDIKGDSALSVDVDVVLVKKEEVKVIKELPGRVVALNVAQVRPQVDGIITEVFFQEGSYVEKGQQLYQIDSALYEAEVSKAKANYDFLRKKRYRFKKLLKIEAISRQEFQEVHSAYVGAKENLKRAKINLGYSKVYAPISGYIGISRFTKGALVKASQDSVLSVISQLDQMFVDVRYPASDFEVISKYLNCKVLVEMDNGVIIEGGLINSFEREIDNSTDSFLVRVKIDNEELKMAPGMYVGAKFFLKSEEDLTVPIKSTYRDVDGSLFVWYANDDNIVSKKKIIANRIFNNKWIIDSGLEENDVVIYEGVQKIYEGALINPNVAQGAR